MIMLDLSVVIPCYEMGGSGVEFLNNSLAKIYGKDLDYSKFEVVVSDHSVDDAIKECCDPFTNINLKYVRNEEKRGSMSGNLNNCIVNSSGKYIKPLFQDDLLMNDNSLQLLLDNLQDSWMAHEYTHFDKTKEQYYNQRTPYWNDRIIEGINTIGPPSSTIFLNDGELFDENLLWFMDIEFYHRLYLKYGEPTILKYSKPFTCVTTWSGQTTNTRINTEMVEKETSYINSKYTL